MPWVPYKMKLQCNKFIANCLFSKIQIRMQSRRKKWYFITDLIIFLWWFDSRNWILNWIKLNIYNPLSPPGFTWFPYGSCFILVLVPWWLMFYFSLGSLMAHVLLSHKINFVTLCFRPFLSQNKKFYVFYAFWTQAIILRKVVRRTKL